MNNCSIISVQEGVQMHTKNCPSCGKEQSYSTKKNLNRAIRKNYKCMSCAGRLNMSDPKKKQHLSDMWSGIKRSEETKRKISETMKGTHRPDDVRIKLSIAHGGDGDLERLNNGKLRTGPLKRLRKECLERDNHACVYCGKHDGELHAHHILSWARHEAHRYFLNNLITLCKPCHIEEHRINGNI